MERSHLDLTCLKEIDLKKDQSVVDLQCCVSFRCEAQWYRTEKHRLPWWLSGKESACNAGDIEDMGSIPGSGRSPGGKHGKIHFNMLAWRIPRTEESGRLPSMGLQRVGHNWSDLASTHMHTHTYIYTHTYISSFQILFHYSLLCDVEYNSLGYTVGSCCLSILYIVVCIC